MINNNDIFNIAQVALTAAGTGFKVIDVKPAVGDTLQSQAELYMAEGYIAHSVWSVMYANSKGETAPTNEREEDEYPYCQVIVVPIARCVDPNMKRAIVFMNEYSDDSIGWHLNPIATVNIKLRYPDFTFENEE